MMEAMEGTLYQHGVDVVFAGHVHAYESSYPVFRWGLQWTWHHGSSQIAVAQSTRIM